MPSRTTWIRFLGSIGLALWIGGLAFYGGVALPELHRNFAVSEVFPITQHVTNVLNGVGALTLVFFWALAAFDRGAARGKARAILLATSTVLLILLVVLHRIMDGRIDGDRLGGFYPLHRVYLIASTIQWFANLGLLGILAGQGGRTGLPTERPIAADQGASSATETLTRSA